MTTNKQDIVKQLLEDEQELILRNGENELFIETEEFNLTITYYLDCEYEYFPLNNNSCEFNIFDIYLTDNITNEECFVESDQDIECIIKDNAHIDDWSNDNSYKRYYPQCY